jgi:hypothetical protein
MTPTTASELKVGDVFFREGRPDTHYRVLAVQWVPIYGFFGNLYETVQVTVDHPLTGRANVNLSPDEPVTLVVEEAPPASVPSNPRSRWPRRRKG